MRQKQRRKRYLILSCPTRNLPRENSLLLLLLLLLFIVTIGCQSRQRCRGSFVQEYLFGSFLDGSGVRSVARPLRGDGCRMWKRRKIHTVPPIQLYPPEGRSIRTRSHAEVQILPSWPQPQLRLKAITTRLLHSKNRQS